jgi:nitroimidazol reductase NimA-like FMN-containing flavoprotein (pyridoxamine 5'-phosphate oxidase superfamily)
MDHVEYVYTEGMDQSEVDDRLRSGEHGVVALADGGEAYAVPLSYHYDGQRLLLRVSDDGDAEKVRFLERTERATFVRYEGTTDDSWSVHVRGPIRPWDGDADDATLNEWFPPVRLFDEPVEDTAMTVYELAMESVVGRRTVGE